MKKIMILALSCFLMSSGLFAGDVAVFKDIGFSKDGKVYFFGEYGKTDKKFIPYGEIYGVDVAKNEYIPGKVFKSQDKSNTKASKDVFEELYAKHYSEIQKYECYQAHAVDLLYVMEDEGKGAEEEIVFKSFEESEYTYHIKLIPTFYGNKSSFYISVSVYDKDNNLAMTYKAGTPSVKRPNVTQYKIVKIFTNETKDGVVFVIEKKIEDENGVSIRYMVETTKLDSPVDGQKR
ncbi:MAG: DUF2259 domain-containing protein [Treponema sp.]|uniref:DUF2259 domain-containing protein n=1 Tax=Treponema sp. TaxID=166 RepID=UPI001B497786|nr:DUF2259 domain-containing protein [Treponema sp.]MBP5402424.1 DUF2259 domain-containing protein [Treponema sp.]MBR5932353.1 DUF2259 domain-containing protein [Treponema sp.]